MPHVIVKFFAGRSDADKLTMANAVATALNQTMGYDMDKVSVAVEEINEADWMASVYEPEIVGRSHQLIKLPGYGSLAK